MDIDSQIDEAAKILRAGGIVAMPTETVYGLAADACSPTAVRKIFEAKGRPFIDPLIVHVSDMQMARSIAVFDDIAEVLAEKFWPGPLTIILKKKASVPDITTAGMETVAVRMPAHPIAARLIARCGFALAAPSANPFGYISPTCAAHVRDQLGDRVDMILDGGECSRGVESTIVMPPAVSTEGGALILRHGPICAEELATAAGINFSQPKKSNPAHPVAPGMLKSHYAPKSKLFLFKDLSEIPEDFSGRVVHFVRPSKVLGRDYWLTESGDVNEAARNLFALLRTLDKTRGDIYCQMAPDFGAGRAVNDRLSRASFKG